MVVRSMGWGTRPQFPSWLHHSLLCEPTQGASRPRACLSLSERRGAELPQSCCEDVLLKQEA